MGEEWSESTFARHIAYEDTRSMMKIHTVTQVRDIGSVVPARESRTKVMGSKFTYIVAMMAALAAFTFGINRLSTQFHPYGNWIILVGVLLIVAAVGAWAWDSKVVKYYFSGYDSSGVSIYSWGGARRAVKREKEEEE